MTERAGSGLSRRSCYRVELKVLSQRAQMSPSFRATLAAFLIFTAYFIAGSFVSDSMRFPYGYVSAGGLVLFLLAGYLIARHYTLLAAGTATALAALFATLVAWGTMALLSPASAPTPKPQAEAIGEVVVLMTVAALFVGLIGAWIGGRALARKA